MKKILILSLAFLMIAGCASVGQAQIIILTQPFNNIGAREGSYFQADFDILVMDFVIPGSEEDSLQAITFRNLGTAQDFTHISKVIVWKDEGQSGFQGMGIDRQLGTATWNGLYSNWYLDNMNEPVPGAGLRLFVSVETPYSLPVTTTIKFSIPMLSDRNDNGSFDVGDTGIYFQSGENLPTDESIINPNTQTLYQLSYDNLAPKAVIDNLPEMQLIAAGDFTLTGLARDRGGSSVASLQVAVNDEWFNAENTDGNYSTWKYEWNGIEPGEYELRLKAKDFFGNVFESEPTTVYVADSEVLEFGLSHFDSIDDEVKINEKMNLTLNVLDVTASPVPGKEIELFSSKGKYDTIEVIQGTTDENGQAMFTVSSTLPGASVYFFKIDNEVINWDILGLIIPISSVIEYETAQTLTGRLIKTNEFSTVYQLDNENVRHVFPNENVYFSWFNDFNNIETISASELASYPLSDNVRYKPGSLIKMPSVPKVYVVDDNYQLRWMETERVAILMHDSDWTDEVDDMSEAFFTDYFEGTDILAEELPISVFDELFEFSFNIEETLNQ